MNFCIKCECGITGREVKIGPHCYAHESCIQNSKRVAQLHR